MSQSKTCKCQNGPKTLLPIYIVKMWREDYDIDCDSMIWVADWAKRFTINRLDNDVSNCVHRCVVGTYQIGRLYDYKKIENKDARQSYMEEGIASALLHFIASYEMINRDMKKTFFANYWSELVHLCGNITTPLDSLAEWVYKYQRWMLYWDMGRKKRWNEKELEQTFHAIIIILLRIARNENCNLARGFQACMQKLLDQEIKNH